MLKIYGTPKCPDCVNCKANFDLYNIEYVYLDIMDNLKYLKEFLHYRDHYEIFDRLKKIGDICIPAIIDEDGNPFTDWEKYLKEKGLEPKEFSNSYCEIGKKNC